MISRHQANRPPGLASPRRTQTGRAAAVLAATTILLAANGCGQTTTSTTFAPRTVSQPARSTALAPSGTSGPVLGAASAKATLIAKADAICQRLHQKLAARKSVSTSVPEIRRQVPTNAKLEQTALIELEKLKAPPAFTQQWQTVLADRRHLANDLTKLAAAAEHNDEPAIASLIATKEHDHQDLAHTAAHDGFQQCANT